VLACAAMITLMGFATMYLWNWLIPALFSGPVITFIKALGLLVLGKLLTHGFFGGGRGWKGKYGRSHHCGWHCGDGEYGGGYWKKRWEEKMKNMTPEEKEKFKKYYYDRCGWKKHDEEPEPEPDKNTMAV
ncbi:MAG: hypothetical protein ACHQFW_09425, partial [Chitinophagales bacterium]